MKKSLLQAKLEHEKFLTSILGKYKKSVGRSSNGRTMDSDSINLGSNPSLPTTSNKIPVEGGFKTSIDDYKWRKGMNENPETIKQIEQKKLRIAPQWNKGNYQYITPECDIKTLGKKI